MILINLSNQIGAGPRNISLNLIRAAKHLPDPREITFLTTDDPAVCEAVQASGANYRILSTYANPMFKFARFFHIQLLLFWMTATGKYDRILAFGNFLLVGRAQSKAVLMHHPYLVDDELLAQLSGVPHFMEQVKRALFRWTLTRVDTVILQSDYMRDLYRKMYPQYPCKQVVIPNPVSDNFESMLPNSGQTKAEAIKDKDRFSLVYASRFYPHKNHAFLLELARAFAAEGVPIELTVTLDRAIPGAARFLDTAEQEGLAIRNIGEVSQPELAQVYTEADAAIFPSRAETFGNPLVEAIRFALPVIAPQKGYALAVLGDSGIYYEEDDLQGCVEACRDLFGDPMKYAEACAKAYRHGQEFPGAQDWCRQILATVNG